MNYKNFFLFFIPLWALLIFSCGSTSQLRLETTPPKATATITVLGTSKKKELGTTPLTQTQIPSEFQGVPIIIEISQPGYVTENIIIPDISGINVDLRKSLTPLPTAAVNSSSTNPADTKQEETQKAIKIQKLNIAVDRVFEAIRKVQVGKNEEALKILAEIKKEHPELSAVYEIEGNSYFLSKNLEKALESYNEALKYNPDQINLLQMKFRIEKALGLNRKPANEKGVR